ncbi:MAG TPA: cytochrome C oxidase subunit IV family protein [Terriglobales bacterium]|jgi:cytochrome c oxidase subunit 4|nr:cytochrome C oxidase subunit IV family protein [Terriglobales bacterium]
MSEHVVPLKTHFKVWIALMSLMVLTAFLSTIDLGSWGTPVALGIAVIKAMLVILFFMHVKYESQKITWVVVVAGFFWLGILLVFSLSDYLTRGWAGWSGH